MSGKVFDQRWVVLATEEVISQRWTIAACAAEAGQRPATARRWSIRGVRTRGL